MKIQMKILKYLAFPALVAAIVLISYFLFGKNKENKIAEMDNKVKTEIEKGFGKDQFFKGYPIIMGEKVNYEWEKMSDLRNGNDLETFYCYKNYDRYDRKNEISYEDVTVYDTLYDYYNSVVSDITIMDFILKTDTVNEKYEKYDCYKRYLETLVAHKNKKEYQIVLKKNVYYCQKFEVVINDKLSYFGKVYVLFTNDKLDKSSLDNIKQQYKEFLKVKSSDCK